MRFDKKDLTEVIICGIILFMFGLLWGCALNPDLAPDRYIIDGQPDLSAAARDTDYQSIIFSFVVGAAAGYIYARRKTL